MLAPTKIAIQPKKPATNYMRKSFTGSLWTDEMSILALR